MSYIDHTKNTIDNATIYGVIPATEIERVPVGVWRDSYSIQNILEELEDAFIMLREEFPVEHYD